ncbi:multidrug efflux SMR transporter [Mucilaginibacter sp. UR6-1]|uniref:DMT family transporter n=1 Tax=Mucilaginibacter sp. UR6-1 TaxID=1435643 RepID=UPI001E406997|nr:multidrug efflux SMR transporter [Mucilaginibacter sp. UR6-1]MCC8410094.1 multidrug efflux SMR transporter [Mucilaginibacter sp. UR6-1]
MKYVFLALAILCEVIGSSFIQASNQFSKLVPSVIAVVAYLSCLYFFSISLKSIPLGVAYAIWGGLGIVLTALVSVFVFRQSLDAPAVIGMTMIVSGVIVMNVFSRSISH